MGEILLADDNLTTQKVFQLSLQEEDTEVRCFNTGQSLLSHLGSESAEIVALNLSLPDGNGYDLCRQIKSNPLHAHIPVVLLVGAFQTFDEERAQAAGCSGHLSKPFETSELVDLIRSLLHREDVDELAAELPDSDADVLRLDLAQSGSQLRRLEREIHLPIQSSTAHEQEPPAVEKAASPRTAAAPEISASQMEALVQKLSDQLPQELRKILPNLIENLGDSD